MGKFDTVGFVRHHANMGTGTVWKILTHSIPVVMHKCVLHLGSPIQTSTDEIAGCSMEGLLS